MIPTETPESCWRSCVLQTLRLDILTPPERY